MPLWVLVGAAACAASSCHVRCLAELLTWRYRWVAWLESQLSGPRKIHHCCLYQLPLQLVLQNHQREQVWQQQQQRVQQYLVEQHPLAR